MWPFKNKKKLIVMYSGSSMAELDYDNNVLWARAFPKPEPLTPMQRYYLAGMQNGNQIIAAQQQAPTTYLLL